MVMVEKEVLKLITLGQNLDILYFLARIMFHDRNIHESQNLAKNLASQDFPVIYSCWSSYKYMAYGFTQLPTLTVMVHIMERFSLLVL
jgi:hypothetical protein